MEHHPQRHQLTVILREYGDFAESVARQEVVVSLLTMLDVVSSAASPGSPPAVSSSPRGKSRGGRAGASAPACLTAISECPCEGSRSARAAWIKGLMHRPDVQRATAFIETAMSLPEASKVSCELACEALFKLSSAVVLHLLAVVLDAHNETREASN